MARRTVEPPPQLGLIDTPPEFDEARLRAFNVDRTPRPVVRQGLEWLLGLLDLPEDPIIVDCAAGEGAFLAEVAQLIPRSHRVAIEPREECRRHLERHAHEIVTDFFVDAEGKDIAPCPKAHVFCTNPAFADRQGKPLWMQFWRRARSLLLPGGAVMHLGTNDIGQRGEKQHALWGTMPPTIQARIAGPIGFRGVNEQSDLRCYSWWTTLQVELANRVAAWLPFGLKTGWLTCDLPWLPTEDREWRRIPGTEWGAAP